MISLSNEYRQEVRKALLELRENFTGTAKQFALQHGINDSVFSRIKTADGKELDGLLRDSQWLDLGLKLNVGEKARAWTMVATEVYSTIEEQVTFCQQNSQSLMFVDDCGIGKTYAARYLSRTLKNCFWLDARQGTTKQAFVRLIAQTVGVESTGRLQDVKNRLKHALRVLPNPIIIIDEAGAPSYDALMELLEFWNATEGACGWYLMGADGLRDKVERGMDNHKVGFAELFSRFNDRYNSVVPTGKADRLAFYNTLITEVLKANMKDRAAIPGIVRKCLTNDTNTGNRQRISGLRRAQTLVTLHDKNPV